jgi:hypothetical protein
MIMWSAIYVMFLATNVIFLHGVASGQYNLEYIISTPIAHEQNEMRCSTMK